MWPMGLLFFYTILYRNLKLSMRFFELSYTSSLHFIVLTPMVPELRALGFFTIGHMHVAVFWGSFLHRFIKEPETFHKVLLS
jgi:hypothetical protein